MAQFLPFISERGPIRIAVNDVSFPCSFKTCSVSVLLVAVHESIVAKINQKYMYNALNNQLGLELMCHMIVMMHVSTDQWSIGFGDVSLSTTGQTTCLRNFPTAV